MKTLVTGGAGFIASHIVDALLNDGHDVAIVDDMSNGRHDNINPLARVYDADVSDADALNDVFARERPEMVSHHAALTSVRHSMAGPALDARVNVIGSINVVQSSVEHGVSKLIFASSAAVYSEPRYIPMDEEHPIDPQSGYGLSKHTAERYIELYAGAHGMAYTVFRYGNVFGPRQDPQGEAGVIAIFTEQLLTSVQPTIFGDGAKTRDYVFVGDIARANLLAMAGAGDNDTFNLARGIEVSDFDVFDAVRRAAGSTLEPFYAEKRPGEAERVSLDASKAARSLGWTPQTDFVAGVEQVVAARRSLKG